MNLVTVIWKALVSRMVSSRKFKKALSDIICDRLQGRWGRLRNGKFDPREYQMSYDGLFESYSATFDCSFDENSGTDRVTVKYRNNTAELVFDYKIDGKKEFVSWQVGRRVRVASK